MLKELPERAAVENVGKAIGELGVVETNRREHVRGLALAEGVHARLTTYAGPCLVERAVEPEARFIFEEDEATTGVGFFLIAGKRSLSQ